MSNNLKLLIGIWWSILAVGIGYIAFLSYGKNGFSLDRLQSASLYVNICAVLLVVVNYLIYKLSKKDGVLLAKRFLEVAIISTVIWGFVTFNNWYQGKVEFNEALTVAVISTLIPVLILAYLRFKYIGKFENE